VIGAIGIVAWIAIGSPMTIADLKTDIQNIKNEWASPGTTPAVPPAAAGDPNATTDPNATGDTSGATGGDTTTAPPTPAVPTAPAAADQQQQPSPPQFTDLSSLIPPQQDNGTTNGTAAPTQPLQPVSVAHPGTDVNAHPAPPVGLTPQQEATTPPHHHHFVHRPHQPVLKQKVQHHAPHSVAKTLPGGYGHGKGDPGWYTIPGHHHCFKGTPGCFCTDKSKCHVTVVPHHNIKHHQAQHHKKQQQHHKKTVQSHLAYTGQFHYAEETPISDFHWDY
jgi:hypothetical protein